MKDEKLGMLTEANKLTEEIAGLQADIRSETLLTSFLNKKYFRLWLLTNLSTPHALLSPTYLLNIVQLEIAPFGPPTTKTLATA